MHARTKVLWIKVEITVGDYDQARVVFSDREIRDILSEGGSIELKEKVNEALRAIERQEQ